MDEFAEKYINYLIQSQKIMFVGSVGSDGFPAVCAMLKPLRQEGVNIIYFTTHSSTNKVNNFINTPKSCLYFCDENSFQAVLLKGNMEILTSREQKQLLWQPGNEIAYPGGVDDPNFCALKFTAISCRCYYDLQSKDIPL